MYYIIGSIPSDAIAIVHGDQEAIAVGDHDGVQRRVTNCKVRRLLRREIASNYQTLDVEGAQAPPAAIYGQGFNKRWSPTMRRF